MTITFEGRPSDSPYVESVTWGRTEQDGATIRPAESNWHLVITRFAGKMHALSVGALTRAGVLRYQGGAELVWIRFRLGAYMPHLSGRDLLDCERTLPDASGRSFWLDSMVWDYPTHEQVETFINRLIRRNILAWDGVVDAALRDEMGDTPARTVRHRFLRTTGQTQTHIRQLDRARRAAGLLQGGMSILDTVFETGYFDQPHLTRALKRWIGYTPAQIVATSRACRSVQDAEPALTYPERSNQLTGS